LQAADAVQADARIASQQGRPLLQRFLDPAFAKVLLTGCDHLFDLGRGPRLADGDKLDLRRVASGHLRCGRNLAQDFPASVSSAAHRVAL